MGEREKEGLASSVLTSHNLNLDFKHTTWGLRPPSHLPVRKLVFEFPV